MKRTKEIIETEQRETISMGAMLGGKDNPFDVIVSIDPSGIFNPLVTAKGEISNFNGKLKIDNYLCNPYEMLFSCESPDEYFKKYPISMTRQALIEFFKTLGPKSTTTDLQTLRKDIYLTARESGLLKEHKYLRQKFPDFFNDGISNNKNTLH